MNKQKAIQELMVLLEGVYAHPKVPKEICDLVLGTGKEKEFLKTLSRQLEVAKLLGENVVKHPQFEKLKDCKGLYSMHIEGKEFNIRILYTLNRRGEILLHCFYEKEGKTVSEYSSHVPVALTRMKEMEE